jgi:group I intron endonuclease
MTKKQKISGIYQIVNTKTKRSYIGATKNFVRRVSVHMSILKNGTHSSSLMQKDFDKYGEDSFIFGLLIECTKEELVSKEKELLNRYKPSYNTYLTNRGGVLKRKDKPEVSLQRAYITRKRFKDKGYYERGADNPKYWETRKFRLS